MTATSTAARVAQRQQSIKYKIKRRVLHYVDTYHPTSLTAILEGFVQLPFVDADTTFLRRVRTSEASGPGGNRRKKQERGNDEKSGKDCNNLREDEIEKSGKGER